MDQERQDSDQRDDLSRGMDRWQLEMAVKMRVEYGHDRRTATALSSVMRADLERGLRKPQPLCIVTCL